MDLTIKDRVILYNQYEILKHLNPEELDIYELNQAILSCGFKYNYDELTDGFYDELDESVSKYVFEVFDMYRSLISSYNELSYEEKKSIDMNDIKFKGYDGNEETDYYGYAMFVLEGLRRYDEIYNSGDVVFNSHRNMLYTYNSMLNKWHSFNNRYGVLSLEQIKEIINK